MQKNLLISKHAHERFVDRFLKATGTTVPGHMKVNDYIRNVWELGSFVSIEDGIEKRKNGNIIMVVNVERNLLITCFENLNEVKRKRKIKRNNRAKKFYKNGRQKDKRINEFYENEMYHTKKNSKNTRRYNSN